MQWRVHTQWWRPISGAQEPLKEFQIAMHFLPLLGHRGHQSHHGGPPWSDLLPVQQEPVPWEPDTTELCSGAATFKGLVYGGLLGVTPTITPEGTQKPASWLPMEGYRMDVTPHKFFSLQYSNSTFTPHSLNQRPWPGQACQVNRKHIRRLFSQPSPSQNPWPRHTVVHPRSQLVLITMLLSTRGFTLLAQTLAFTTT